jgi:hypothetical protein
MIFRASCKLLFVFFILVVNITINGQGQIDSSAASKTFLQRNVVLTGEAGIYGEVYNMSGEESRRPASTGRIYLRPTLTLFDLFSIPMEFFISTEGSGARQDINHYGIAPSWSWGKLYLGDFTENYSELTLSGINIRGAGVNLYPGGFRFAVAAGYTQRSVQGGAGNGSYDRFLIAAKTGYGNEDGSHFYLTMLRAKDKISSLKPAVNAFRMVFPNGNDEIPVNSIQTIKWYTSGTTQNVKIMLSRDGGSSFETIIASTPNSGFYNWTVTGPETFTAIIKIVDIADSTIQTASQYPFRIGFGIDTKIGTLPVTFDNSFAVTPQENLLVGLNTQVNFLNDMFKIGVEGVGSAYTKDMTADDINIDTANIPSFLKKFYKPKISTNVDYAVNSFLNFAVNRVNVRVGYKFVGPGFNSLGLSYMINDQQEINGMVSVNMYPVTVFVNYGRVNDNLISQKLFTTVRNQYGLGVTAFTASYWTTSAMMSFMDMGNNASNDTNKTDFTNMLLSLNNNFTFNDNPLFKTLSVNYAFQNAINSSFLIKNNKSTANSVNLTLGFEPIEKLASSFSVGLVNSIVMDSIKTFSQNYTLTAGYPLLEDKLQNSASITASVQSGNTAFNFMLSSSYALTKADFVSLQIGTNTFTNKNSMMKNYNEFQSSLNISHRF